MKFFGNQNFIFTFSLLLVAFLLAPSIVKMAHALIEHEHLDCKAIGELHIHEVEFDCDFQDFNFAPQIRTLLLEIPIPAVVFKPNKNNSFYSFLSKHQKLHFGLRGPPSAS